VAEPSTEPLPGSQPMRLPVTLCLLAGGEGRRMGGLDKGLVDWCGAPLAQSVLKRMTPQVSQACISANRNAQVYADLWRACTDAPPDAVAPVFADAPDLPGHSGPLAGMLTALRQAQADWVQFVPCDSPRLPPDLIARLLAAAIAADADTVVPQTLDDPDTPRHHWVCALVHRRALASLETHFAQGERKVSRWIGTLSWRSVFFEKSDAFANINNMETPHASR